jgi:hypothetical protein
MEVAMKITKRSVLRLPILVGYMMVITSLLACSALAGGGGAQTEEGSLQLDDGVVKVKTETGAWMPVAGKATFELVGKLESTDPWTVSGQTLSTNETTKIDEGLEVGDLVRVRGAVLDDDTWVAYSIERAEEQTEPLIILIGVVDSIDPWVVNGITLNVTDTTDIQGEIKTGMIVRVEVMLMDDGTWKVVSIAPLGTPTETSGCVTVVATVVSVTGNEIQFLGWPTTVTFVPANQTTNQNDQGENNDENTDENSADITTIQAGQTVSAVVCVSEDGSLVIVTIIALNADENETNTPGEKVLVCHRRSKNPHTLSLPPAAVPAHLAHGDTLGACP